MSCRCRDRPSPFLNACRKSPAIVAMYSRAPTMNRSRSNTQRSSARTRYRHQERTLRARFSHHVLDALPSRGAQGSQGMGWRRDRIAIGASRKFDGEGNLQAAWTAGADRSTNKTDAALGGPGRWLARSQEGGVNQARLSRFICYGPPGSTIRTDGRKLRTLRDAAAWKALMARTPPAEQLRPAAYRAMNIRGDG